MSKEKNTVIDIFGYKFETHDTIYEVVPKFDADAPDGLKQHKTTKYLNRSAENTATVGMDNITGLWDTGLYEESPMYNGLSPEVRREIESKVRELIVIPYENKFGKGKLDHTDPESTFWNYTNRSSFKIKLHKGRIFNTNNPEELLQLYIAIASKTIAPKDLEDSPEFRTAQFAVENKEKVKNATQENDMLEVKTMAKFGGLLDDSKGKKTLSLVLEYVGLKPPSNMDEFITTSMFKRWCNSKEDAHQNKNLFLEAVSKANTQEGYKELSYYRTLKELHRKNTVKKEFENYTLDGEVLGTGNLKNCAANIIKDKGLESKLVDIINK